MKKKKINKKSVEELKADLMYAVIHGDTESLYVQALKRRLKLKGIPRKVKF